MSAIIEIQTIEENKAFRKLCFERPNRQQNYFLRFFNKILIFFKRFYNRFYKLNSGRELENTLYTVYEISTSAS